MGQPDALKRALYEFGTQNRDRDNGTEETDTDRHTRENRQPNQSDRQTDTKLTHNQHASQRRRRGLQK